MGGGVVKKLLFACRRNGRCTSSSSQGCEQSSGSTNLFSPKRLFGDDGRGLEREMLSSVLRPHCLAALREIVGSTCAPQQCVPSENIRIYHWAVLHFGKVGLVEVLFGRISHIRAAATAPETVGQQFRTSQVEFGRALLEMVTAARIRLFHAVGSELVFHGVSQYVGQLLIHCRCVCYT